LRDLGGTSVILGTDKRILFGLLGPLGAATVMTLVAGLCLGGFWGGYLANVSAGFAGLACTVGFVDRILGRLRKEDEAPRTERLRERLRVLANTCMRGCRVGLGYVGVLQEKVRTGDLAAIAREVIRLSKEEWEPGAIRRIAGFRDEDMRVLAEQMEALAGSVADFMDSWEYRLQPNVGACLMDIERDARAVPVGYRVFPEVWAAGPEADELRATEASRTGGLVSSVLRNARKLFDLLEQAKPQGDPSR